jgi:hypothetical protein
LNSGLCACKAGAHPLEPHLHFILLWLFWRRGSHELFARPFNWLDEFPSILGRLSSLVSRITGISYQHLARIHLWEINILRKEGFILAYGFRGFSPWLAPLLWACD